MSVNEFLDVLLGDPSAAPSLVWLPLIHRIAAAENGMLFSFYSFLSFICTSLFYELSIVIVLHPVECVSCGRSRFTGMFFILTLEHPNPIS